MMKKISLLLLSIILSFSCYSQNSKSQNEITSSELYHHVSILASDSLQGRYPGTTYDKISAKYIKDNLSSYGLELLGNKGYQFFSIEKPSEKRFENTHLMIDGKRLTFGIDYTTLPSRGSDSLCANSVFVGLGNETDYLNVNVKKKWAVFFKTEKNVDSTNNEMPLMDFSKIEIAKGQSAAGIIILDNDGDNSLTIDSKTKDYGMPIFILKKEASRNFLKNVGDIDSIKNHLLTNGVSLSQNSPITICGKVGKSFEEINTENVIALLKGSDPNLSDEYIVIGAHFDHLGLGGKNANSRMPDTIAVHNGADDNASGVAAMLEIAQKMVSEKLDIKRSIIFMAFGAEEMGIVGSQRFVDSDIIPVQKIKAMINLDMVGRLTNNKLEIGGTKTSEQSEGILKELNADSTFALKFSPGGFGPSDHAAFYAKNIPVFFITTGIHSDYHTPFDDVDKINANGMQKVAEYTYRLAYKISNLDSCLTFTKSGSRMMPGRNNPKFKVTLGIIPDVSGSENNGLKAIGVTEGRPAANAGMKNGDVIISINGKQVTNINDYMERLSELKSGTAATVVVLRNMEQITLTVNL
ncbi:MAG: M20/M25/M40 family metallo-hydrolase [Bacteroidales bacterium]